MEEEEYNKYIDRLTERIRFRFIKNKFNLAKHSADLPDVQRINLHFRKTAEWCYKNDADFEKYVDAQFRGITDPNKILPQYLYGPVAEQKYRDLANETFISPEGSYNVQVNYLRNQLYLAKRAVENVLVDDDIRFNAWFRILISKEPIDDVIFKYKDQAREELKNKHLLEFLEGKEFDLGRILPNYGKE